MDIGLLKILNKIRILPLLILFGCALLVLKVQSFLSEPNNKGVFIVDALATSESVYDKKDSLVNSGEVFDKSEVNKEENDESNATIIESENEFNILSLTPERVGLLKKLAERRKKIKENEVALEERKSTLLAIEKRIDNKIKSLNEIKFHVEQLVEKREDIEKKATNKLVVMYEKMKPKIAASILEGLDLETLIDLMSNFKESKASAILSNMIPKKARILTMELMNRKKADGFNEDIPDLAFNN